jgi:hypothetical protein
MYLTDCIDASKERLCPLRIGSGLVLPSFLKEKTPRLKLVVLSPEFIRKILILSFFFFSIEIVSGSCRHIHQIFFVGR